MIKQIKSKRVELPVIFLIENEEDWKEMPKGLPYIIGTQADLPFITLYLEFQTLLKSCKATGLPINWENVLRRLGYSNNLKSYELCSGGDYWESSEGHDKIEIDAFIEDQYVVNFDRLSELKIVPKWLDDLKSSVEQNIIDEVMFDPTAFNKQLGLNVGSGIVKHNQRNLLILDVSGSIPRAVVKTTVALAKLMSKKFYADILITSGQSVLIDYDNVQSTDIEAQAEKSGCGNEGEMFSKIISEPKDYNTVIAFGDNDNPEYYLNQKSIPCKITVETLYSLHTDKRSENIVGYARCFKPSKTPILVKDWIDTIN
jgi:hypothetical protein